MSLTNCSMRRAAVSARSDCVLARMFVVSRYMNHVSRPPFTASTKTTRPTKYATYLPNRPRRRPLSLRSVASCI